MHFLHIVYKYGRPFLFFSVAGFLIITLAETLHHIPGLEFLNNTNAIADGRMWAILAVAVIVYALTAVMSCRASVRRFEAVDM